jgi:5-methylcytosine-specific restriction endonuclease McrA
MITVTKDGRTIREGDSYSAFRTAVWRRQVYRCLRCGRTTFPKAALEADNSFHVHHVGGRGMGGGKRDDVFEKVEGLCGACHREAHGR